MAEPSPARSGDAERIEALAQSVAEKSRRLIGEASDPLAAADLIARAGPEASMVAMHANTISRSVSSETSLSSDMASALSMPGRTLQRYLASTDQQLTQLLATGSVTSQFGSDPQEAIFELESNSNKAYAVRPEDILPAPGLARRIEDEDGPQKTGSAAWQAGKAILPGPSLPGPARATGCGSTCSSKGRHSMAMRSFSVSMTAFPRTSGENASVAEAQGLP